MTDYERGFKDGERVGLKNGVEKAAKQIMRRSGIDSCPCDDCVKAKETAKEIRSLSHSPEKAQEPCPGCDKPITNPGGLCPVCNLYNGAPPQPAPQEVRCQECGGTGVYHQHLFGQACTYECQKCRCGGSGRGR